MVAAAEALKAKRVARGWTQEDFAEALQVMLASPDGSAKSNREVVDDANDLARRFYKMHGYQVSEGYRFDEATHPQEQAMWDMAVQAYKFILDLDVEDALANLG